MEKNITHQFNLFPFQETKPKTKIKISAAQVRAANEACKKGRSKDAASDLSDIADALQAFLDRIK